MYTTDIALDLTELEASILLGALQEPAEEDDSPMALALRDSIIEQLPEEWHYTAGPR